MQSHRLGSLLLLAFTPFASAQSSLKLVPIPREVHASVVEPLAHGVRVRCTAPCATEDQFAADDLAASLQARGIPVAAANGFPIELVRLSARPDPKFTDEMKAEGYVLVATKDGAVVVANSAAGIFYGAQTLKQLIRTDGAMPRVQLAAIRDWPAMKYRGFHDDLSRGPVPTLDFQKTAGSVGANIQNPFGSCRNRLDGNNGGGFRRG